MEALDIFHQVTLQGFKQAAQALEDILEDSITMQNKSLGEVQMPMQDDLVYFEEATAYYVLKTNIVGELEGESYLIISLEDAEKIWLTLHTNLQDEDFKTAFLLELDNILTASWITVMSDHYQLKAHGDVPSHVLLAHDDLKVYLEDNLKWMELKFAYHTSFISHNYAIQLEFIFGFHTLDSILQEVNNSPLEKNDKTES